VAKDGTPHRLVVRATGFRDEVVRFTDEPPPDRIALQPLPTEQPPAQPQPPAVVAAPAHPKHGWHPRHPHPGPAGATEPADNHPPHPTAPTGPVPANGAPVID
jgi:hypothetical protein